MGREPYQLLCKWKQIDKGICQIIYQMDVGQDLLSLWNHPSTPICLYSVFMHPSSYLHIKIFIAKSHSHQESFHIFVINFLCIKEHTRYMLLIKKRWNRKRRPKNKNK